MTITDYVIAAATGKEVINFDWLNGLIIQIKRLGNNLNQLVILARQGRITTVYLDGAQRELAEIHGLLAAVFSKGR